MRRPEQTLQQQVARFIDTAYPALVWFHVPNGGARSKVEGAILKSMGVKAGVPDIVMILPDGRAGFIELKAGPGKLSTEQAGFRDRAKDLQCAWAEARSLGEVADLLVSWLLPFGWVARVRIAA